MGCTTIFVRPGRKRLDDAELCVATMDNRQAVQDTFGDVYGGADYLYTYFKDIIERPGSKSFLYKIHGELLAFANAVVVDNGQTLVVSAARVKETFQNRGVFSHVRLLIGQHYANRTLYPSICRQMVTVAHCKMMEHKMTKSGWRKVYMKHNSRVAFSISSLSNLKVPETSRYQVTSLKVDELHKLFGSPSTQWLHLFPQERITIAWESYYVMAENVHSIVTGWLNTVFYGTKASQSTSQPQFSLLTAGSYYMCALGICYFVDLFGAADNSEEIGDHLNTHLQRLNSVAKKWPGKVVFQVFAPVELDKIVFNATRQLEICSIAKAYLTCPKQMVLWENRLKTT